MAAWTIIRKDLALLTRDHRAIIILLAMPLSFIAILGFSTVQMLGQRDRNAVLRLVLVDENRGPLAATVIASLQNRAALELELAADQAAAVRRVDQGNRVAAVIIGPDFERRVNALTLRDLLDPAAGPLAEGLAGLDITLPARSSLALTGTIVQQLLLTEALRAVLPRIVARDPLASAYLRASASLPAATDSPAPLPVSRFGVLEHVRPYGAWSLSRAE